MRAVEAYGRWASRNLGKDEALKVYEAFDKVLPQPPADHRGDGRDQGRREARPPGRLAAGRRGRSAVRARRLRSAAQGGEDLALVYLQLAIYLAPRHPLALMSLADLYEQLKKPALALKVYERVPSESPLRRNADIQIGDQSRRARAHRGGEEDTGKADRRPARTISKRSSRSATSCACARNSRNAPTPTPRASRRSRSREKPNWMLFYFRGICYERSKQWPKAEADLKKRARTLSRPAARAQLSRLLVDRSGRQPRRRHEDDPPRRRAAAG